MKQWQPIETAPKDGTLFRARHSYVYNGRTRYLHRKTHWGKTSHINWYGWCYGNDAENINLWEPTHWMPLPDPPSGDT